MKRFGHWLARIIAITAIAYPLCAWLQPPSYAVFSICLAAAFLVMRP